MSDWNCNKCKNENDISLCSRCDDGSEYIKWTNADRIRSLNNEELAGFLCKVKADYQWLEHEFTREEECGEWELWLQSEVEG